MTRRPRLRWWRELLTIAIFYELYSLARNTQGSGSTSPSHAFRNARVVIKLERAIGMYHEESVQRLFLEARWVLKALNIYYGTAHFVVTAGVLMWLFVLHPDRYARWRWTLASTTLLALIGFLAFPLMPPRLITSAYGVGSFEDTLRTIGGLWNFEEGTIAKLSNQYAAMPSLHFGWSLWCCLALWPRLKHAWTRLLAAAHPFITLVAIVATANHYWLDAAAGAVTLFAGWLLGGVLAAGAVGRVTTRPRRSMASAVTPASSTGEPAEPGPVPDSDGAAGPPPAVDEEAASAGSDRTGGRP